MCGFFFQAEDGIRDLYVTGVQTCCSSDLVASRKTSTSGTGCFMPALRSTAESIESRLERALAERLSAGSRRSEERRVAKECRSRWSPYHSKKKKQRR